ncbi:MAG: MFS transporter [Betaproteobacteria bacterium]
MRTLQRKFGRYFQGLWRSPEFMKLWASLTITAFGSQITNLALPLTAAVLLHATPWQMGVLVALETLPFALVSLHAGVLIDRVRKLPIVIAADIGRGLALLVIPVAAFTGTLSIEILFVVGFLCGVQNVVGGAAYQVLLAKLAGRNRLVEANAKIALGETSSALVGPGLAGGLIQLVTAPFAILLDALTFFVSALMLRRIRLPHDVPDPGPRPSVGTEIHEGLKLVWNNRTLLALAWLAGLWQILHHMQVAVLILFATRELGLSAGEIGLAYIFGGVGCVMASAFAQRLTARFGVGPIIVHGLTLTALGWQAFGLISGPVWLATLALGCAMLMFDFGGVLFGINYLALRQAITPDRLLGRMTATMRFLTVAAAPLGSLAGGALATVIGLRGTLLTIGVLGLMLVAGAVLWSPVRRHREMPAIAGD